jgi:hypothetical protein
MSDDGKRDERNDERNDERTRREPPEVERRDLGVTRTHTYPLTPGMVPADYRPQTATDHLPGGRARPVQTLRPVRVTEQLRLSHDESGTPSWLYSIALQGPVQKDGQDHGSALSGLAYLHDRSEAPEWLAAVLDGRGAMVAAVWADLAAATPGWSVIPGGE